ncbi:c-type cytochrome, partial [Paraglaciecola sp.]|uniref:c-type cytochrome n=1 Tax=Paraglaciecola sp. TaxID=1920173 RepID=UPI0030F395FF
MSLKSLIILAMLTFPAALVQATEAPTPIGLEYCTVCHGSQLKGNENIGAPRLSGLPQWYIERQLQNFKQGLRGAHADDSTGGEMQAMVANLSEQELIDIAAWVTQTQSHHPVPSIEANADVGKRLYQSCSACHGANG